MGDEGAPSYTQWRAASHEGLATIKPWSNLPLTYSADQTRRAYFDIPPEGTLCEYLYLTFQHPHWKLLVPGEVFQVADWESMAFCHYA